MNNLNTVIHTLNRMLEVASCMLESNASTMHYKILEVTETEVHIKIENWSNRYFEIELGNSKQLVSMYRDSLKEYREYMRFCKLLKQAKKENAILFQREHLVKVLNEKLTDRPWHNWDAIYQITLSNGSKSRWYGPNADNALRNAAPYIRDIPVSIELLECEY